MRRMLRIAVVLAAITTAGPPASAAPETLSLADAQAKLTGSSVLGMAGAGTLSSGDLNADGIADIVVPEPGPSGLDTGEVAIMFGPFLGRRPLIEAHVRYVGAFVGDNVGISTATGDLDGDGSDDVVFAAPAANRVHVVYGPLDHGTYRVADVDATIVGIGGLGRGLAVSDVDADGSDDLLLGAPETQTAFVLRTAGVRMSGLVDPRDAGVVVRSSPGFGRRIAAGDLDGDGASDIAIAADDTTYLWYGRDAFPSGDGTVAGPAASLGTGDLDGDGYDDLFGAAPDAGAWVVYGGPVPLTGAIVPDLVLDAAADGDRAGSWVASAGDLDGDGRDELAVGAICDASPLCQASLDPPLGATGSVYLLHGRVPRLAGTHTLDVAETKLAGEAADAAGYRIASMAGGDGRDRLIVSAPLESSAGPFAGAVYVVSDA